MSPTDEVSLASGLASVQATLSEHGTRSERIENKIDHMNDRIDVLYPELATLKQQVAEHERRLGEMATIMKGAIGGVLAVAGALVGDILLSGILHR